MESGGGVEANFGVETGELCHPFRKTRFRIYQELKFNSSCVGVNSYDLDKFIVLEHPN